MTQSKLLNTFKEYKKHINSKDNKDIKNEIKKKIVLK